MRTTIVPAQITTVEDKIAGSLTVTQLLLLAAPIFGGSILYILLPPSLRFSSYKLILTITLCAMFGLMAIRVKGRLLLLWAILRMRYNVRPRYYVFDKNTTYLRNEDEVGSLDPTAEEVVEIRQRPVPIPRLAIPDLAALERLLGDPKIHLTFRPNSRNGGLHVTITEIEQENLVTPTDRH